MKSIFFRRARDNLIGCQSRRGPQRRTKRRQLNVVNLIWRALRIRTTSLRNTSKKHPWPILGYITHWIYVCDLLSGSHSLCILRHSLNLRLWSTVWITFTLHLTCIMISCAQVSYKRQHYAARLRKFTKTVLDLFQLCINDRLNERLFRLLVLKPLRMESLYELPVVSLSGGELQRVAITLCLAKPANVFLLDEPSAGLDCEQRVIAAKVIRWVPWAIQTQKVIFKFIRTWDLLCIRNRNCRHRYEKCSNATKWQRPLADSK